MYRDKGDHLARPKCCHCHCRVYKGWSKVSFITVGTFLFCSLRVGKGAGEGGGWGRGGGGGGGGGGGRP